MTQLLWPYPKIVAHRGGGKLAPENTLAAIDCGHRYGHRMIEFDAKISADHHVFLLHDDSLDRTTSSQGNAGDRTWQQLVDYDAGSWFGPAFAGESLPLLSAAAERCRQYAMFANIEIKPTAGMEEVTGKRVAEAAAQYWQAMPQPLLSSFSFTALRAAQASQPQLPRAYLMDEWQENWLATTQALACVALHLNYRLLTTERIQLIKAAGLRILAYTVNHPDIAQHLLGQGVDMICTDRIDIITPDFPQP